MPEHAPTPAASDRSRLLEVRDLRAGYGHVEVLHGVSLHVDEGETVTIVGSNGAGKSTLLKTVVGLMRPFSGTIEFAGERASGVKPEQLVRRGIALVPEGRLLFGPMTVRENLDLGAYSRSRGARASREADLARVFGLFPALKERQDQTAATLSGGEQQMLAIGRALMSHPRLLLLDEPSLGLAPRVIAEIFEVLARLKGEGVTIVLVEQDAKLALEHSDRGVVMRTGTVALDGTSADLLGNDDIRAIYLGKWHADKASG